MMERDLERNRRTVSIALMDENVGLLNTLRSALRGHGYRGVDVYRDARELEAPLNGVGFDLIIGDANQDGGALLDLVRRIRAGSLGRNPFLAVIVTSWNSDWNSVRRAVDAGVDDILLNPISPGKLVERIQQIVHNRKPFIVTADYTGPDRRRDPSRVSTVPEFRPPNTLAEKECGETCDPALLKKRIDAAARAIASEKLRRFVFQIAFLQGLAELAVKRGDEPGLIHGLLDRLRAFALQAGHLAVKIGPPDLAGVLSELHDALNTLAGRETGTTEMAVLLRFADDLLVKAFPEKTVTEIHREVNTAIRSYEERQNRLFAKAV